MNVAEFAAAHEDALEHDPARHILMLGLLAAARSGQAADVRIWSLGPSAQCAMLPSRAPLLLGDLDEAQCGALARELAGSDYAGVIGPDQTAHWFYRHAAGLGDRFHDPMPQRMHSLTSAPIYPGAPGKARQATDQDTDLLTEWMKEFFREATPHEAPVAREHIARGVAAGRYFLWLVDGVPVSTAAIVRRTKTAGGISGVFTPAPLRTRGYAGSVTAAVVEHLYGEGRTMACLNTDLRVPASNRCYAKIGFTPVCDLALYRRVRP